MAGTPGNNSDAVRYTRSDATTQSLVPTLLSIGAAQPALCDDAPLLEQVKEVRAPIRERIRMKGNRLIIPACGCAITCKQRASVQKNPRPQAMKRGAGTDLARSTRKSVAAESEKRGSVNYVISNSANYLYRRERSTIWISVTAPNWKNFFTLAHSVMGGASNLR